MYKQILIDPDDQNLQKIVWRKSFDSNIKEYKLSTVTYGTASASFLATRCLHQISLDCEPQNPELSSIIQNSFNVDDLMSGASSNKCIGSSLHLCRLCGAKKSGNYQSCDVGRKKQSRSSQAHMYSKTRVGEEIIGPPETVEESKLTLKGRWDIVQKLKLNFWKRWQIDYLNSIQGKTKWKIGTSKIKIGDVVIIKENNLPPSVWPLGKVISTHPGKDGIVRVVTLKTKKGLYQRPIEKLDKETRKNYELNLASTELPKWEDFMKFLLKRCLILENIQANNATAFPSERIYKTKSFLAKLDPANCVICKQQSHLVFRCKKFNDLSVNERFNSVKRNRLCIDCYISSHKVALCKSSRNCPNCSKRPNSLLCKNFERNLNSQRSPDSETVPNMEPRITTPYLNVNSECFQPKQTIESFENGGEFVGYSKGSSTMLLSTAVVYCQNSRGELFPLRALLDSGSQSNLITHEAAFALGLKCERVNTSICGVNGTPQFIKNKVSTVVSSKNRQFQK
ncbi:DUF1758 domain-containing protein [Trichonephila clavipes]|nr:DUF1758 domain-containing protein [Trichonephila clavipes]